jgi:hypothetical protein
MVYGVYGMQTVYGMQLEYFRVAHTLNHIDLARAINGQGFLGSRYSDSELARHLQAIEMAGLGDPWPLACDRDAFAAVLTGCLPQALCLRQRLSMAERLDELARGAVDLGSI